MSARVLRGNNSNIEIDRRGLGQFYFESAEKHGNKICQIDATTGQKESFRSVKVRSTRLAVHMRDEGVTSKDIVLCCMKNSVNSIIPILSTLYLGAKVTSLDPSQSLRDCIHCISIVPPQYIFVDEEAVQLIENTLTESGLKAKIIVVGKSEKYKTLSELLEPIPEEHNFIPVTIDDCHETAFIYFSSGTTGLPKGICITHFGLLNNRKAMLEMDIVDVSIELQFSSYCWISAIGCTTSAFLVGGCRVFASEFESKDTFRIIETYKVASIFIPPIYTYDLVGVEDAGKYDTSSLKMMILGGTPISPKQLKKTREVFKHTFVTLGYGSTEAVGFISGFDCNKDRHLMDRLESSGRCVNDTELKVVNVKTRELLGPNQRGEICVKSPYISPGYYNNTTNFCDVEGFIKTGDIGYYDDDECLYVVDRIKEMFTYQAWHVVPSFLEAILQEHPAIKEAAVIGIPHEVDEARPAACIVLKDGAKTTSVEEIERFFTDRVADYHKLRGGIKLVKSLPRSPSNKLQRWKIREMFFKN